MVRKGEWEWLKMLVFKVINLCYFSNSLSVFPYCIIWRHNEDNEMSYEIKIGNF